MIRLRAFGGLAAILIAGTAQAQVSALGALRAQGGAQADAAVAAAEGKPMLVSGVATPAEEAASAILEEVLSGMNRENRAAMRSKVRVYVVRRGEVLLDAVSRALREELPAREAEGRIAFLKASYARRVDIDPTKARRTPAEPRGVTQNIESQVFCFAGEENLLARGWDENNSRARRVLFHELGHAAYDLLLDDASRKAFFEHDAALHPDDPNGSETFAESTEIWFGVYQSGLRRTEGSDRMNAEAMPPALADILTAVYGPHHAAR